MTRALIALVPLLLAFQDTEAKRAFKLQDRVPADFNLFAEIDGVADFLEASAPMHKFLAELKSTFAKLAGKDPLKEIPLDLALKARGQLAFAGRYGPSGFTWVVAADFADEAAAKEIAAKLPAATLAGAVLWLTSSKDLIDLKSDKPLSASDRFKKARDLAGAAPGRLFAYADLEPLLAMAAAAKDEDAKQLLRESGVSALRAYATSFGFEKDAVTQRQIFAYDGKLEGLLGALASVPAINLDLKTFPISAVTITRHNPAAMKAIAGFLGAFSKGRAVPDTFEDNLKAMNSLGAGKEPVNQCILLEADGPVTVIELEDPKGYQRDFVVGLTDIGADEKRGTVDGLDVTVLSSDIPELELLLEVLGHSATSGRRCYIGPSVKALAAVHAMLAEAKFEPLAAGRDLKGLGVVYLDWSGLAGVLRKYVDALGPMMRLPPSADAMIDAVEGVMKLAGTGYDVASIRDGAIVVDSRSSVGLTMFSSVWVAAAMVVPAITKATDKAKAVRCSAQLSQLIKGVYNHSVTKTPVEGSFLTGFRGHAFWKKISDDGEFDAKYLVCPETGRRYRGPAVDDTNVIEGKAAMGMCIHDGFANVVWKWGTVQRFDAGTPEYDRALRETCVFGGWEKPGAKWTYKPEDGKSGDMTIELKEVRDGASTFERTGAGQKEPVRETVVARPGGLRILNRQNGGRDVELSLSADERKNADAWLRDIASDDAERRDAATEGLTRLYARAMPLIEDSIGKSPDPEVQARLKVIRVAAVDHAPLAIAYPLKVGAKWDNAYGESFEVIDQATFATGLGDEPGWRIRVKSGATAFELVWSEDLNIPLAIRPDSGKGWVLEKASAP